MQIGDSEGGENVACGRGGGNLTRAGATRRCGPLLSHNSLTEAKRVGLAMSSRGSRSAYRCVQTKRRLTSIDDAQQALRAHGGLVGCRRTGGPAVEFIEQS
jgi:hypothetical protein